MEFEINDKSYALKFNLGFVRAMDKVYNVQEMGLQMGVGVSFAYQMLSSYSINDLAVVIKHAIDGNVTQKQLDEAIEAYAEENDGLESLFETIKNGLEKSPVTKATVANFKKNLNA